MSYKTSDQYEDEGVKHYDAAEYEQALAVFQEGLARFPGDPDLRLGCAMSHIRLGDYVVARDLLEGMRAEGRLKSDILQGLAETYLCLGRREQALECVKLASGDDEKDPEFLHSLALRLYRHNLFEEAAAIYRRAVKVSAAFPRAKVGLAACLHRLNRREEAVRVLVEALESDPECWEALSYLGNLLFDLGRRKDAREAFEKIPVDEICDPTTIRRLTGLTARTSDRDRKRALEARRQELEDRGQDEGIGGLLSTLEERMEESAITEMEALPGAFSPDPRLDAALTGIFGAPAGREGKAPVPARFDRKLCEEALEALAGFVESLVGRRDLDDSGLAEALVYGAVVLSEMKRRFNKSVAPAAAVAALEEAVSGLEPKIPAGSAVQAAWTGLLAVLRG